jgi:hypothetical protein
MRYSYILVLLVVSAPLLSLAQGLPHYEIQMDPAAYDLLYSRDIFSDSLLKLTTVRYPTALSPERTDGWIRFKGHSTRYYPKKAYRLKFDADVPTPLGPVRSLNLNAMYTDKAFIRENFCWLAYADIGALAPGATYATATINGHDKGLFLQVDKIDKYFLTNRGRKRAPMYEADDLHTSADLTIQPDSILKLYYAKEIGDAADYSDLAAMIATLNGADSTSFPAALDNLFDVRSILGWFAVNILVTEGDSYNKNYFLYRDTSKATHQWTVIPWDYDLSCGRTGDVTIPYPWSLLNDRFAYTFEPLSGPSSVLKDRFLKSPVLMERLRVYLDSLLTNVWTEERLISRVDSLAAVVDPFVRGDPEKWGTYEDFAEQIEALKYYVVARRSYLVSTFTRPLGGEYHQATIHPTQLGVPYHAIAVDGRQLATLTFHSMSGLDSILVLAHAQDRPPFFTDTTLGYVNRWIEILPSPATARFQASLQWMWMEPNAAESEVVNSANERQLRCQYYLPGSGTRDGYVELPSHVNGFGNFVNVEIVDTMCGSGRHFALLPSAPSGVLTGIVEATSFQLLQNYPNPFNPTTEIQFALARSSPTRLEVFNVLGNLVATLIDGTLSAGVHSVRFDASGLASGTYFYRLTGGQSILTKKMLIVR